MYFQALCFFYTFFWYQIIFILSVKQQWTLVQPYMCSPDTMIHNKHQPKVHSEHKKTKETCSAMYSGQIQLQRVSCEQRKKKIHIRKSEHKTDILLYISMWRQFKCPLYRIHIIFIYISLTIHLNGVLTLRKRIFHYTKLQPLTAGLQQEADKPSNPKLDPESPVTAGFKHSVTWLCAKQVKLLPFSILLNRINSQHSWFNLKLINQNRKQILNEHHLILYRCTWTDCCMHLNQARWKIKVFCKSAKLEGYNA